MFGDRVEGAAPCGSCGERFDASFSLAELEASLDPDDPGAALDLELVAACVECHAEQRVHFAIDHHLTRALAREERWLLREVHTIARAYGWTLEEILSLPRSGRRTFVKLIYGASR